MEFLFIDDSGDNGIREGSTDYFILAGLSIEDRYWKEYFWKIQEVRRQISQKHGISDYEFKGTDFFSNRGGFFNSQLLPHEVAWIYHQIVELLLDPQIECFSFFKFKKNFYQPEDRHLKSQIKLFTESAWRIFMARYESYLLEKTMRASLPFNAMIHFDFSSAQEKIVRKVVREHSRKWDQRDSFPMAGIVEDVVFRDSKSSYLIQMADVLACSISKIVRGGGQKDIFAIDPEVARKVRDKVIFCGDITSPK